MWLKSPIINTTHGFSMRHGGISPAPYLSLNLGGTDDTFKNIEHNRTIALGQLGISMSQVSYLNQIHSNHVCRAIAGKQTGDALVSNDKNSCLAIGAADCYPVLFYDDTHKVIGAAHCGWKGTLSRIVKNTINEMCLLGAEVTHIKVAIGQGICMANYEVSQEVIQQFCDAHFPSTCWENRQLNLLEANRFVALESGILPENIWAMNRCTTEPDFFSYRRDNGKTGRMWAVITMQD